MTETDRATQLRTDAAEWAALRRVAMLAARGGSDQEVSAAIVAELERLGVPSSGTSSENPLGQRAERLLEAFGNLLATSVLGAQERANSRRLVDEQRALRQVATLAASSAPTAELFSAVTRAAGEVLDAEIAALGRFGPDHELRYVASWSRSGAPPGLPDGGELGAAAGVRVPVVVEGQPWGVMSIFAAAEGSLAPDAEARLTSFTELLGTAIANAGTRDGLTLLADEHAAVRRVATLVAEGAHDEHVYAAVTMEAALHLDADFSSLSRIDDDEWMTTLATWRRAGDPIPVGRWPLSGESISATVAKTGRAVRRDDYGDTHGPLAELVRSVGARQGVAVPVIVEDRVWGVMAAFSDGGRELPSDTEQRLAAFTTLLAMAIANTESRRELAKSRARIVATADGARRQIERNLHDGAQQRLVSLGLELQGALALSPTHLTDLRQDLGTISEGLTEAQDRLREIAHGVHPAILAATGLGPALKSLARRSSTRVKLDVEVPQRFADQIEVAAYYVVREALENACRHAHAGSITVRASVIDDVLRIAVSDDGVGGAEAAAGSGLVGLKDRVETLSGTFKVHSPEGSGTTLSAEIPVASPRG